VGGLPVSSTGPSALASGVAMDALPAYAPGALTTTTMTGQSIYSMPQMYSAPQAQMNGMVATDVVGSQAMASQQSTVSQYVTYAAQQAPVPGQCVGATGKVVVHPPVTVTAEEFARINGTLVTEPLPVTAGFETVGAEANREVVVDDTVVMGKTKLKKKKKSKSCC